MWFVLIGTNTVPNQWPVLVFWISVIGSHSLEITSLNPVLLRKISSWFWHVKILLYLCARNSKNMKDLFRLLKQKMRGLFLIEDVLDEKMVIDGIRSASEFRGAKLWILILAVYVASLGLNINSAAVIIGAMLISPLMGPIIGIGVALAILDTQLLRRSVRNLLTAALFSVLTATVYFLISPYSVAQSELLARTSPTIYDVLIAFCGGLAGIIALSCNSQRWGNVIPGVAIATALMPPLCTTGFGIATGNWQYIIGALYLFVINATFITLATYFGAHFIIKFQQVNDADPKRHQSTRRWITLLVVLIIVPSVILTIGMIRKTYYEQQINLFVKQELSWNNAQVVDYQADYDKRTLNVVIIGDEIDSLQITNAENRLALYSLDGVTLRVIQSNPGMDEKEVLSIFEANQAEIEKSEARMQQQQARINELKEKLHGYEKTSQIGPQLFNEMKQIWPDVENVSVAKGSFVSMEDSTMASVEKMIVVVQMSGSLKRGEEIKLRSWVSTHMQQECQLYIVR